MCGGGRLERFYCIYINIFVDTFTYTFVCYISVQTCSYLHRHLYISIYTYSYILLYVNYIHMYLIICNIYMYTTVCLDGLALNSW